MEETTRAELLADPSIILDDKELMESLLTATDIKLGNNVVDLRHVAIINKKFLILSQSFP